MWIYSYFEFRSSRGQNRNMNYTRSLPVTFGVYLLKTRRRVQKIRRGLFSKQTTITYSQPVADRASCQRKHSQFKACQRSTNIWLLKFVNIYSLWQWTITKTSVMPIMHARIQEVPGRNVWPKYWNSDWSFRNFTVLPYTWEVASCNKSSLLPSLSPHLFCFIV
jgi:hypothetical protein